MQLFTGIRAHLIPFETGDLIRIPFAGELFGDDIPSRCEPDGHERWPIMQDAHNRAASRGGYSDVGWLQNETENSLTEFCAVTSIGVADSWKAQIFLGVRPVFMVAEE